MSDTAQKLFGGLRAVREAALAAAPGLANAGPELKAELSRLATQGSMELASAFFGNGTAFVPYGPGQYTPAVEQGSVFGQEGDTPQTSPAAIRHARPRTRRHGTLMKFSAKYVSRPTPNQGPPTRAPDWSRSMLVTFLLVLVSTFLVLRWSVRQPRAAHATYTSLEKLFLRPGEG